MLSQKQLQDICLMFVGDHRQCRYLQEDPLAWQWYCIKHKKVAKKRMDETVNEFLENCKITGIDPHVQGVALGDNCPGYPIFKNIEQGYDKSP
ncbi:MAG: hypothetical protein M0R80_01680 [Proteobacteria bacterium]|jgi:hypothetical protein|nr:hypothetical protein [Pseudomonadota bacterium]